MTNSDYQVVVGGDAAGFAQEVRAGKHALRSDEPLTAGGTDTGPGPYELLLAALGT
jgi:putative redox protein